MGSNNACGMHCSDSFAWYPNHVELHVLETKDRSTAETPIALGLSCMHHALLDDEDDVFFWGAAAY